MEWRTDIFNGLRVFVYARKAAVTFFSVKGAQALWARY